MRYTDRLTNVAPLRRRVQTLRNMKTPILLFLPFLATTVGAQSITAITAPYFTETRKAFVADNAYNTVAYVESRFRVAGNTGFNESIFRVEAELQKAGFVKEKTGEQEAALTYRIEKRPLRRPTWEPVDASLTLVGEPAPLLRWKTNRNMMAIYSGSTPAGGVEAEAVFVGRGRPADLEGKDLKGKILVGEGSVSALATAANQSGALGAVTYNLPEYTQPEKHPGSIQFSSIQTTNPALWGILLSYSARERIRAAMAKGPVRLKVVTAAKTYPSEELTIVANVRGVAKPDERFVFSAHVQEPGANDNASGVGTLAEMARVTAALVKSGRLKPARTLTFLWGEEISSTRRYIAEDSVRRKGIKWGMSLDMVGEDTKKTGGTFLIEKMQDPSAIWTRGNDKHSEWGGSPVKESDLFPHYYNDFVINRCLQQGKFAAWVVKTNPFEGGSDHTPFLNARIPGLLLWHFTDVYYHTDGDRLENVSRETMRNVGISALVTAYTLILGDANTASAVLDETFIAAKERLTNEFALSAAEVVAGKPVTDQQHILETWYTWYDGALATTSDIPVTASAALTARIAQRQLELKRFYLSALQLKPKL